MPTSSIPPTITRISSFPWGKALAASWIGLAVIETQHFALGPATVNILAHETGHPRVPVIALWNARVAA